MPFFEKTEDGIEKLASHIIDSFGSNSKYQIKNKKSISSIFLAGAPGAGKTEFLGTIFNDLKQSYIVIDIDKYRNYFKGYNGENSSEYQNCSVRVADKILKYCFKNDLNFVFDGTFRNYNKVKQNFDQCAKYNRKSLITLIFQEPRISYYYTFLRKLKKCRNVPIDVFVDGFYSSIFNVFKAKADFNNIDLIIAHKIYHPLNKDKSEFKMDYKIDNLKDFCNKYDIAYKKGIFLNKEKLKLDIEKFNDILVSHFLKKSTTLGRFIIWIHEKIRKLH